MVSIATALPEDRLEPADVAKWLATLPIAEETAARKHLQAACALAVERLGDDTERTGQRVTLYALNVADILVRLGLDEDTLSAAVLHRLVSRELATPEEIHEQFGAEVARMVGDMVRIERLIPDVLAARETAKGDHSENLRRLLLDLSSDVRVLLILLAERLYLMRRLKFLPDDVQQRYSRNTRDIFAPIANRLGIWQVKWELEDLALRYLEPDDYRDIANRLDGRRQERVEYLGKVGKILEEAFASNGIHAQVSARPKHIFSIWRKMRRKDVDFSHIFDVRAVRVLVDTVAECYGALGVVHGLWRHIPGEFDDYIATPKANLYQSIHTVVIGPEDKPLEIQIRTQDMHEHAERGVAAHWRYKEQRGSTNQLERRIRWLRQWLESRDESDTDAMLARDLDAELEPALVYVLSPQGKVIELPYGATPVDFAYAVHTSVGHRCRGAKVDGRMVPLTHRLQSGSTVEILTVKEGGPSRDWLSAHAGYVKTARARNRIRQWFKHQDFDKHLAAGKGALDRELARLGRERPPMDEAARRFNFRSAEDLFAAIGRGDVSVSQVAGTGAPRQVPRPGPEEDAASEPPRRRQRVRQKAAGQVIVEGVGDLMTSLGRCCKPVPRDPVVGYITRGRGVTVHRADCTVVSQLGDGDRQRLVEVVWAEGEGDGDGTYAVDVLIMAADRKGLLRDITSVLSNADVDVTDVKTHTDRRHQRAMMRFTVQITNIRQLERLLEKLWQIPDVTDVRRAV